MTKIILSVAFSLIMFVLKYPISSVVLFAVASLGSSVYFHVSSSKKADILHSITFVVLILMILVSKINQTEEISTLPFLLALVAAVFYDTLYKSVMWFLPWAVFWASIGYGFLGILTDKYGNSGYLLIVAISLIALRNVFERRKDLGRKICDRSDEANMDSKSKS
ncbi:MAG: hypothetical protein DRP20_00300 [Thermotogae bacterium]|nr:MAG: hypothetical protein DRP20_00300 [Thermotogota bacterium]